VSFVYILLLYLLITVFVCFYYYCLPTIIITLFLCVIVHSYVYVCYRLYPQKIKAALSRSHEVKSEFSTIYISRCTRHILLNENYLDFRHYTVCYTPCSENIPEQHKQNKKGRNRKQ